MSQRLEPKNKNTHRQMVSITDKQSKYIKKVATKNNIGFSEAIRIILDMSMELER